MDVSTVLRKRRNKRVPEKRCLPRGKAEALLQSSLVLNGLVALALSVAYFRVLKSVSAALTSYTVFGAAETDYVAVAERFLHTPYLWGGRDSIGLDCSGLVQSALEAAGVRGFPRDTRDQEEWAARRWGNVPVSEDFSGLQRGDLVFWSGHVGIMTDSRTLLHANAHHMLTVAEPLATAARRIAFHHAPVRTICRPPAETGWTGMM